MLRLLIVLMLAVSSLYAQSQVSYPYQDIKLEKPRDYVDTEPMALSAANLLITTPFVEVDAGRANALVFLSSWMAGTKAYHFYMDGVAADISEDKNLLSLYIAAMAKYTLENKTPPPPPLQVETGASKLVLAYCDDPKNNFKLKKKYRKYFEKN
jgi:hypothetical protein